MPPILSFLPRLLLSAVAFTLLFRLLASPLDRASTPRVGRRSAGQVVVTPLGFAVRLLLAVLWASYVAWLATTWTRREDVTYDWFYYLLAASVYLGPAGLLGRKADAAGASRATLVGSAVLALLCLLPAWNERLFGWWIGVVGK
ncbi:MAG TPA: hypothetical protein VJ773_02215 [Gemmatimonadales bacterium]|nr:hypothetical protein [Gemmatimonadales bacterium]